MVKTAGNTVSWEEHQLTVPGKGGYTIRAGNTFNLLGGELPVGQSFGLSLDLAQTPIIVFDDTITSATHQLYEYSIFPMSRPCDHLKFARSVGTGITDFSISGTYTGTTQKIYRIKISLAESTDKFQYSISTDGGTTFSTYAPVSGPGTNITGSVQTINDGLSINFTKTTGHTLNDVWEFYTPMPQNVEVPKLTTGSGTSDLTLTIQSAQSVVATHRDIFTIKIMTAATPNTYQYSTDGGVTYNGSNINCATSATELGSTNVMVAFGATTGHTAGNIWSFHVFPATSFPQYSPGPSRLLIGWVENTNTTKTKHVMMSTGQLGESQNINVPDTVTIGGDGITLGTGVTLDEDGITLGTAVTIDADGITYRGDDFTSDGATLTTATPFLKFSDANNVALGGFSGKKISVGPIVNQAVPSPTGSMGDHNQHITQYLYTVGSGITYQILDLNRGMINDLTSLSQSSHEQTDGMAGWGEWLTAGINALVTSIEVNDGNRFNTTTASRISVDLEEMLVTNVSSDTLTVARGHNNTTAAPHDAGSSGNRNINYSWDNAYSTSGARQHVRIPPNNAKTARSLQAEDHQTYEPGWALSTDIEANNLGPHTLVLERSQGASTGQPNRPWNTQWRQIGGAIGGIAVSGQTTVDGVHPSNATDYSDVTFVAGTGMTLTTSNSAKTVTFEASGGGGRSEVDIMTDAFIYG